MVSERSVTVQYRRIGRHRREIRESETRSQQRTVIAAKGEEKYEAESEQDQEQCDQRARHQHGQPETDADRVAAGASVATMVDIGLPIGILKSSKIFSYS